MYVKSGLGRLRGHNNYDNNNNEDFGLQKADFCPSGRPPRFLPPASGGRLPAGLIDSGALGVGER